MGDVWWEASVINDDDPNLVQLRTLCEGLVGAREAHQWGRIVFVVDDEPFAAYGGDPDYPFALTFRPRPQDVDELLARRDVVALGQLTSGPWLSLDLSLSACEWSHVERLVRSSHAVVVG